MSHTTMRVKKTTVKRLSKHGGYGDTLDEIINEILDKIERGDR